MERGNQSNKQCGLTSVELVVVLTILPIILIIFSTIFINASIESLRSNARAQLAIKSRRGLSFIEESVRTSREFLPDMPSNYFDHYAMDGDRPSRPGTPWSYKGKSSNSRVLILDQYATKGSSLGPARLPVYKKDSPYNCSDPKLKHYNEKIHYLHIIFVRNRVLYRRTIVDNKATACPGDIQIQKLSCPPDWAGWGKGCEDMDEQITDNVDSFTVEYYDKNNKLINNAYSSPTALQQADRVKIHLKLAHKKKKDINFSLGRMMTKGNQ